MRPLGKLANCNAGNVQAKELLSAAKYERAGGPGEVPGGEVGKSIAQQWDKGASTPKLTATIST